MQEMVGIDYLYVANWSLWPDVKILLRTIRHVVRQANLWRAVQTTYGP